MNSPRQTALMGNMLIAGLLAAVGGTNLRGIPTFKASKAPRKAKNYPQPPCSDRLVIAEHNEKLEAAGAVKARQRQVRRGAYEYERSFGATKKQARLAALGPALAWK
jgi:hypothetical protein